MEDTLGDVKKFTSAARGFARNKPIVMLKPPHLAALTQTGALPHGDAGRTR